MPIQRLTYFRLQQTTNTTTAAATHLLSSSLVVPRGSQSLVAFIALWWVCNMIHVPSLTFTRYMHAFTANPRCKRQDLFRFIVRVAILFQLPFVFIPT